MPQRAILLAAGASTRMGRPKALLPHPGGGTFLSAACAALAQGGAGPVLVVVAAPHGALVERAARACGARVVWNPQPERGQISSLAVGLEACGGAYALVALVDHPALEPDTVRALLAAAEREPGLLHLPAFRGERGHPLVVPASLAAALRGARAGEGARDVFARLGLAVREHPLDDAGVLLDLDTPDELRRWQAGLTPDGLQ